MITEVIIGLGFGIALGRCAPAPKSEVEDHPFITDRCDPLDPQDRIDRYTEALKAACRLASEINDKDMEPLTPEAPEFRHQQWALRVKEAIDEQFYRIGRGFELQKRGFDLKKSTH